MKRFLFLLCLASCGLKTGDYCTPSGAALCASDTSVFWCEDSKLTVELPCPGPGGCTRNSNTVVCDFHGVQEGAACVESLVGKGVCNTATQAVFCRNEGGSFVFRAATCSTCVEASGLVNCMP